MKGRRVIRLRRDDLEMDISEETSPAPQGTRRKFRERVSIAK